MNDNLNKLEKKLKDIVLHIENNRYIYGDKYTLDDVHNALKNTIAYLNRLKES